MSSSYYVTYGTDRLTFGGPTGSIAWDHIPPSGYYEQRLWAGDAVAKNASLNLSAHPSAFDAIRVLAYGQNAVGNSQIPCTVIYPYQELRSTNKLFFSLPFFGSTATTGVTIGYFFGTTLTGCSGTAWKVASAFGTNMNAWKSMPERYDFSHVREIWGIHYG